MESREPSEAAHLICPHPLVTQVPGAAVVRYAGELDHLDAVFPVEYSESLTSTSQFRAAPPVVGRLIVRTLTPPPYPLGHSSACDDDESMGY